MSSDQPGDMPAFPQHGWSSDPEVLKRMQGRQGMTLRDWFAGQAMPQVLRDLDDVNVGVIADELGMTFREYIEAGYPYQGVVARRSYKLADAMLAERSKPRQ